MTKERSMCRWFKSFGFWFVLLMVLLGSKLALALFVFQHPANVFLPDSFGYEDLAVNLIQRGRFDVPEESALGFIRTPGYPAFIASIYWVVGRMPGGVIFIQLILDALTCLFVWQIGRQYFSSAIGVLGAFIYAISLNATIGSLYLLSDTLFTFLLVVALFFLGNYWIKSEKRWCILAGVFLGLMSLVRPIGLYLAFIWVVFFAIKQWKSLEKQWYRDTLVLSLFFIGLVVPWFARNYALTGRVMFSAAEAINLYCCFAPAALAEDENISFLEARANVDAPFRFQSLNKLEPWQFFLAADHAGAIILHHPVGFAKAHLKGVFATLFEPVYRQWLQLIGIEYIPSGFLSKLLARDWNGALVSLSLSTDWLWLAIPLLNEGYIVAVYLFAVLGVFKIFRQSPSNDALALTLLCVITILYLVIVPGPGGGLRFRIPAEPLFALLAAVGLAETRPLVSRGH
jgi:4-amino-4-deoxy-L-arabinose transferase-like glycosyltransferase